MWCGLPANRSSLNWIYMTTFFSEALMRKLNKDPQSPSAINVHIPVKLKKNLHQGLHACSHFCCEAVPLCSWWLTPYLLQFYQFTDWVLNNKRWILIVWSNKPFLAFSTPDFITHWWMRWNPLEQFRDNTIMFWCCCRTESTSYIFHDPGKSISLYRKLRTWMLSVKKTLNLIYYSYSLLSDVRYWNS